MKWINGRKFSWFILGVGCILTIIAFFFLPQTIPMHFTRGIADGFSDKIEIFLFPLMQLIILVLSGNQRIKYILMHSKTELNDVQYNWTMNGICIFILIMEIYVIYRAF